MPITASYAPRHPEDRLLYRVVAANLESFLAGQQERDHAVLASVEEEFRRIVFCM
jgi:hypothetical protein